MTNTTNAIALKAITHAEIVEAPRPLIREIPPAEPFPTEALGTILGSAATAIQQVTQAPLAIGAQSVLAAATLAVQAQADVVLPMGHAKPISGFFMTIASSGERKNACDEEALHSIRQHEEILKQEYDAQLPSYHNKLDVWGKQRTKILNSGKKKDQIAMEADLEALGPSPCGPLTPMLTCTEPSFEGLCRLYANGRPSLGLFSNEGGQFIGGYGMSEDKKLTTVSGLSNLWDGVPVRRVRAGDGALILSGRRLSIHLMAQPDVAAIMLSDRLLADQGTLSRLLPSCPETTAGTRFWCEPPPEARISISKYNDWLSKILKSPLPLAPNTQNELRPRQLPLSQMARRMWINFADQIESQIGEGGALEPIRGLANKLPEHAARLAAVLTLIENLDAAEISGEQMAAGIALAQHYATEALRLFAAHRVHFSLDLAQRTINWLQNVWTEPLVSLPDIYQCGPNAVRDKYTATKITDILTDHGWLIPCDGAQIVAGHRRKNAWWIAGRVA